jgi:hypothetical protein
MRHIDLYVDRLLENLFHRAFFLPFSEGNVDPPVVSALGLSVFDSFFSSVFGAVSVAVDSLRLPPFPEADDEDDL